MGIIKPNCELWFVWFKGCILPDTRPTLIVWQSIESETAAPITDIIISLMLQKANPMQQDRYHINFKNRRTTITMDIIISELLAVKLGMLPDAPEAHSTVRAWFENTLHEKLGVNVPGGNRISQDARQYAIEALADKKLMNKVWDWRLKENG